MKRSFFRLRVAPPEGPSFSSGLIASKLWQLRHSRESLAFILSHWCCAICMRRASNFSWC